MELAVPRGMAKLQTQLMVQVGEPIVGKVIASFLLLSFPLSKLGVTCGNWSKL